MTERKPKEIQTDPVPADRPGKKLRGWLLFPLSLFPLAALFTYDPASIGFLRIPAAKSTNWVGPAGDLFAYYGYAMFGLAIWAIPLFCVIWGLRAVSCGVHRPGRKFLWRAAFLVSAACLMQVMQPHAPGVASAAGRFNIMCAGGATGYFLMTKILSPALSDTGAGVVALTAMALSLVFAIGPSAIASFFSGMGRWATGAPKPFDPAGAEPGTPEYEAAQAAFEAARKAKEDAKKAREEEKRRLKEEKAAAKKAREAERAAEWEREQAEAAARREEESRRRAEEEERRNGAAFETGDLFAAAGEEPPQPPAPKKKAAPAPRSAGKDAPAETGGRDETPPEKDDRPYVLPPVDLLNPLSKSEADHSDVEEMCKKLIDTLRIFNIDATMGYTVQGPVVTKYAVLLAPGTKYSVVTGIQDNLKGALHAKSLRIETPIPGEEYIGIEVPNRKPAGISFREIFESDAWRKSKAEIPLLFGKDAAGKELVADLASMPHMLVAGATGQGKSVCLNSLIVGLLMSRTPEQLKLIMVDPKSVEFTPYSSIPHLLVPVVTDNTKVMYSLNWAVSEMEKRLKLFKQAKVRNIYDFNHRKTVTQADMFAESGAAPSDIPKTVPYIVIIIDEVADLMSTHGKEVSPQIARLTAKSRAAGIHLILATQRPDTKTINGTIKSNIPGRVAFKTSQSIDSRTILDATGAENLIGRGDMLFKGKDNNLVRAQGAWISDDEIARITQFIEEHSSTQFDETFAKKLGKVKEAAIADPFAGLEGEDEEAKAAAAEEKAQEKLQVKAAADADDFKKAVECIINTKRASTSHFQRQLGWGYNHAAKILDKLAERGIVSAPQGMGPRQIVMDQDQLVAILNGGGADEVAQDETDFAPIEDDGASGDGGESDGEYIVNEEE